MVLYGPPGAGKTTLARIVAGAARGAFEEESAVNAGRAEVRAVIARAEERRRASGQPTIFFLDEIHRFNKAQQDALLPAVEEGLVTLIGATTENPYFEVNSALLSRSQIYELRGLEPEQVRELLRRALADPERGLAEPPAVDADGARAARRAGRRRRAHRAGGARAGGRDGARLGRLDRPRRGRGRAAAQGGHLRQAGRPPLRLHLGLDQVDARLRPRRLPLLPGGDARGRRGPALHRPADGDPRLRGHRQRGPEGARGRHAARRMRSTGSGCRSARSTSPRPPSTWRSRRSRTRRPSRSRAPWPRSASTARSCRPTTCATPTTPVRRSSAAARATVRARRARRDLRATAAAARGSGRALLRADRPRAGGRARRAPRRRQTATRPVIKVSGRRR